MPVPETEYKVIRCPICLHKFVTRARFNTRCPRCKRIIWLKWAKVLFTSPYKEEAERYLRTITKMSLKYERKVKRTSRQKLR